MKEKGVISRLFQYMGIFKITMAISFVLAAISAVVNLSAYTCVYNVAKEIVTSHGNVASLDQAYLIELGWRAVFLISAAFGLYGMALLFSHITAFNTVARLRIQLIRHIGNLPLGYHSNNPSGKQRKIIEKNTDNLETIIAHQMPDFVQSAAMPFAFLVFMFLYDWRLSLTCLIPISLGFMILAWMLKDESEGFARQYQKSAEDINNAATEYVRGISVIKVFGQSVHSIRRFKEAINAYRDDALAFTMACKPGYVGFNTVVNAAFLVLIPAALIGMTSAGDLTAFIENFLFYLIFAPACASVLNKIMYMSNYKMQAMESMRRIDTILLAREQSEAQEPQMAQGSDICFEHVTFTYPTGEQPAVSDVSFTAKAGTVTALVGHSGSGKTTIGTLVPRFYDVQEGRITLGGVELSEISRQEDMGKIAFVFQNPKLLKTTLEENIRGGCKNASREDILRAARLAQCDDILAKLPEGIDSIVGGKGVYFSGGEVQRVAIARAILKDAPVIILDEVTAFADPENEVQIQAALKELTKGKTVIMIAHRLSTIQDADQILVMKAGRLVEQGTHQELLGKNGEYAHMWADYNQAIAWKIDRKEEVKPC